MEKQKLEQPTKKESTIYIEDLTAKIVREGAKQLKMGQKEFLEKALREYIAVLEKSDPHAPIEYEQVTINVPKQVMELLRYAEPLNGTPQSWIEYCVSDNVRAGLESGEFLPSSYELTQQFKLTPILEWLNHK